MKPRHYPNFDVLRLFLAAEVVVLHIHYALPAGRLWLPIAPVPGFIALSGFVIAQSWESYPHAGRFFWKRFLRIAPALALSFGLVALLFNREALWGTFICYLTLGLHKGGANGPLWSLGVEEILYAGLVLWASFGGLKRPSLTWAGLVVSLAVTVGVASTGNVEVAARVVQSVSFCMGLLAYHYRERLQRATAYAPLFVGVSMLAMLPSAGHRELLGLRDLLLMALSAPLAVLSVGLGKPLPVRPKFEISYGLYIYHMVILTYLSKSFGPGVMAVWTLPATVAFALVSWFFVEQPALRLKQWRPLARRVPASELA